MPGYTCFAAIAYTVPDDIADAGYKVPGGKYFVSVDVGGGRIQWHAAAARNSAQFGAQCSDADGLALPLAGSVLDVPPGSLKGKLEKGEGEFEYLRRSTRMSPEVFQLSASPPVRRRRNSARNSARNSLMPSPSRRRSRRSSSATCTTARRSSPGRRGASACSATPRTR